MRFQKKVDLNPTTRSKVMHIFSLQCARANRWACERGCANLSFTFKLVNQLFYQLVWLFQVSLSMILKSSKIVCRLMLKDVERRSSLLPGCHWFTSIQHGWIHPQRYRCCIVQEATFHQKEITKHSSSQSSICRHFQLCHILPSVLSRHSTRLLRYQTR